MKKCGHTEFKIDCEECCLDAVGWSENNHVETDFTRALAKRTSRKEEETSLVEYYQV